MLSTALVEVDADQCDGATLQLSALPSTMLNNVVLDISVLAFVAVAQGNPTPRQWLRYAASGPGTTALVPQH